MSSRKRTILQVLAYTLYGFAVFLFLLYMTFPYDLLRQRLVEGVSQGDVRLAVARIRPGFPPGLTLYDVRLLADLLELPGAMMHLQTVRVQPVWWSWLSGTAQMRFDAALYNGDLRGEMHSATLDGAAAWQVQGHFANLHIERHPWVQKDGEAVVRGRLGGDLDLTLAANGQMQRGTLNLRSQPAVFSGGQHLQLLLKRPVTCDTLESQLNMTSAQLQIVSFTCKGDDLTIQARGTVNWQRPIEQSGLDLHLQIGSETAYEQELAFLGGLVRRRPDRRGVLSFSIRGTVQRPRFGA